MLPSRRRNCIPKGGPTVWNRRTLSRKAAGREPTSETVAELPPRSHGTRAAPTLLEVLRRFTRRNALSRFPSVCTPPALSRQCYHAKVLSVTPHRLIASSPHPQ